MIPMRSQDFDRPLADYFWIAGVDGQQLLDAYKPQRQSADFRSSLQNSDYGLPDIIHEHRNTQQHVHSGRESPRPTPRHVKRDSYHRLSRLSDEARLSIQSLDNKAIDRTNSRSSAAVRKVISPGSRMSTVLSDVDFDKALKKFTTDRDSFFVDLGFNSNAAPTPRSQNLRPQTQKIVPEDLEQGSTRSFGSIKRHVSYRDRNSTRRQPSTSRRLSTRTSNRMSSYNSVIPQPESLRSSPIMHPLRRKFEPVLLDRYPRSDMSSELKRRGPMPDYIPMFAFPNDVNIISSDTRPRSTWHEFSMTAADNSTIPAVCVTIWIPMSRSVANELERRCDEWRQANMTDAEIEMAGSLAERLASERAKLSRLLSRLPTETSGSGAREELEDEISLVEERIALMSDMLRPLRHGAASKIDGLTDGETGLWIPRAYGVLGRDTSMTSFYKEWLRAVVVPMMDGAVLRVPASSPKVGMWQPLERYVSNICCEAPSPIGSKTQVDINVRELHLYAKKDASNELPGSRNTNLYPLFRALTIPNIVTLFEYMLAESRIVLLSSHTSMLQAVGKALVELIWPLRWAGVFIPVLPARLVQVLDAPCPYICGIERHYEKYDLPEDDFVLVDLDKNEIQSPEHPPSLPKQQKKKLLSLLHLAAPHHHSCGVAVGPPSYMLETYPFDTFPSENEQVFSPAVAQSSLTKLASMSSTSFGAQAAAGAIRRSPVLNAFLHGSPTRGKSGERPRTGSTARRSSQPGSDHQMSPVIPPTPTTPISRNDSGFALHSTLREKRSGNLDISDHRRSRSIAKHVKRKPSVPFVKHGASPSNISMSPEGYIGGSTYAPSMYAQSTLAASTVMPGMVFQPAQDTETTSWAEGHRLEWRPSDGQSSCAVCNEKTDDGYYRCFGCGLVLHGRCAAQITVVCPDAFYPDQVRAAFARFFASLFYAQARYMRAATAEQKKRGMTSSFDVESFVRSLPQENASYINFLRNTQAFNEFVAEREHLTPSASASIALFDALVAAKKGRSGRRISSFTFKGNPFASRSPLSGQSDGLGEDSSHTWRLVSCSSGTVRGDFGNATKGRDYHTIITRTPAKLEEGLMKSQEKVPKLPPMTAKIRTLTLRERMNGLSMHAP